MFLKLITFGLLLTVLTLSDEVFGTIGYTRHISELRIKELQNLAVRLQHSVNRDKLPCDEYFEYVCSRNRPMFTILGNLPGEGDLINLLTDLQNDEENFEAKQKMMNFFLSCNIIKSIDDCYRETFDYFRPLFGYIVAAKHLDRHDHNNTLELLKRFVGGGRRTEHFATHNLKYKLEALKDKFELPLLYFKISDLNNEYESVKIYSDTYEHNKKSLDELRRGNLNYMKGIPKTILDWTIYMYQSRNKPMSYYYSTLNVHIWMMFYNSSGRMEQTKYEEIANCLKLPQAINALDEARFLAVVYIKSFQNAWNEYRDWIISSTVNQEIYDYENDLLKPYNLNNKILFFTLYAQNFCDFGKELAENVFFLGLKQNLDFHDVYKCGHQTLKGLDCI